MPRLTLLPEDLPVDAAPGATVLDAALAAGIPLTHACGGQAKCSTCRVLVLAGADALGPRTDAELEMAGRRAFGDGVRLACQTRVLGDVTVRRLVVDEEDRVLVRDETTGTGPKGVGAERRVAVLFADVRDFTAFAESQLPYDVIHVLNRFFLRVHGVVDRHGGRIDNFMGDGAMALFGMDGAPDATARAVHAGLDLLDGARALSGYVEAQFHRPFRIGVGVHAGPVILGAVGAGERRRLTAIGDTVNLASRVEGANRAAGTELLVTQGALDEVRGRVVVGRRVDLALKGKSGTHALFEVTGWVGGASG